MENTYPLAAYLITHNLWEIASFCVSPTIAEEGKKKMPAVVADVQ